MTTLIRTGALLFGLLIGISAVSAAPELDPSDISFSSEEFWTEIGE